MDSKYIDLIKDNLGALDKATIWIFVILIVLCISLFSEKPDIEIDKIKIKKEFSGLILYATLCCINFQILHSLQNLNYLYHKLALKDEAIAILNSHVWLFNPFMKSSEPLNLITDYIGLPLLIVMWWIGFALAQKGVSETYKNQKKIAVLLFFIYIIEGLSSIFILQQMQLEVNNDQYRTISNLIGMLVGLILFNILTKKLDIIIRFLKNG